MGRSVPAACRYRLTPPHYSSPSSLLCVANVSVHVRERETKKRKAGAEHLAAVTHRPGRAKGKRTRGALSGLSAGKTSDRGPPLLSPLVRKELTSERRWGRELGAGGGQTLGSMVTECVINAAMCPVPRTFSTPQDPFSDSGKEREGVSRKIGRAHV